MKINKYLLTLISFSLLGLLGLLGCSSIPISRVYVNRQKANAEFVKALDSYHKEKNEDKKETLKLSVYYYMGNVNALDGVLLKHGPQ
jgi:hypothetical protein